MIAKPGQSVCIARHIEINKKDFKDFPLQMWRRASHFEIKRRTVHPLWYMDMDKDMEPVCKVMRQNCTVFKSLPRRPYLSTCDAAARWYIGSGDHPMYLRNGTLSRSTRP